MRASQGAGAWAGNRECRWLPPCSGHAWAVFPLECRRRVGPAPAHPGGRRGVPPCRGGRRRVSGAGCAARLRGGRDRRRAPARRRPAGGAGRRRAAILLAAGSARRLGGRAAHVDRDPPRPGVHLATRAAETSRLLTRGHGAAAARARLSLVRHRGAGVPSPTEVFLAATPTGRGLASVALQACSRQIIAETFLVVGRFRAPRSVRCGRTSPSAPSFP